MKNKILQVVQMIFIILIAIMLLLELTVFKNEIDKIGSLIDVVIVICSLTSLSISLIINREKSNLIDNLPFIIFIFAIGAISHLFMFFYGIMVRGNLIIDLSNALGWISCFNLILGVTYFLILFFLFRNPYLIKLNLTLFLILSIFLTIKSILRFTLELDDFSALSILKLISGIGFALSLLSVHLNCKLHFKEEILLEK